MFETLRAERKKVHVEGFACIVSSIPYRAGSFVVACMR